MPSAVKYYLPPKYSNCTAVQSSFNAVPAQNLLISFSSSSIPDTCGTTSFNRCIPKNSPCGSSASVTPSVTTSSRQSQFRLISASSNVASSSRPTGKFELVSTCTSGPTSTGGTCPQLMY